MSSRLQIIKNSLWGNLNIGLRYGLSFIATAFIARRFGPADFGTYQLVFTYLGILDGISLLSPVHLRNYLIDNPTKEKEVVGAWLAQTTVIWVLIVLVILGFWFYDPNVFYVLMFLAALRLFFKIFEYPLVIFDSRIRNDLVQKVEILQHSLFNILRIISTAVSTSLVSLTSVTLLQGVASTIYQFILLRRFDHKEKAVFNWSIFCDLVKIGFPLALMSFLTVFQSRIVGVLVADRMTAAEFGSFQLIFRLLEPSMAIGMVIFGANYTTLAQTRKNQSEIFKKRFFKISALTICVSFLFSALIVLIPTPILIKVFGEIYQKSFESLWLGVGVVISGTIFAIGVQYDMLVYRYRTTLIKYLVVIALYCAAVFLKRGDVSIEWVLTLYSVVPILVSLFALVGQFTSKE